MPAPYDLFEHNSTVIIDEQNKINDYLTISLPGETGLENRKLQSLQV